MTNKLDSEIFSLLKPHSLYATYLEVLANSLKRLKFVNTYNRQLENQGVENLNDLFAISGCDDLQRIGDVIFVHGLMGHYRETWHPKGKRDDDFWPAWLGRDLPNVGVWSLGYEVEPFAWRGNTMPLVDRATNSLALLDTYDIGDRPLIFITHSMGGLLVKQMLRHANDFGTPRWKAIAQQTKGIVFLSTPHSGADLANWIKYIGGLLQTTVSVDELKAHDSRLRELNLLYRNHEHLSQIPMEVYCEKYQTKGILVVNETSADPGIRGVIPIPMDENHISICRPESDKKPIYNRVKRFIRDHLNTPLQPIQLEPKSNELEKLTIDQRSGGVYFGTGAVLIKGDVVGGNQEKFDK